MSAQELIDNESQLQYRRRRRRWTWTLAASVFALAALMASPAAAQIVPGVPGVVLPGVGGPGDSVDRALAEIRIRQQLVEQDFPALAQADLRNEGPRVQLGFFAIEGYPGFLTIYSDGTGTLSVDSGPVLPVEVAIGGIALAVQFPNSNLYLVFLYNGNSTWQTQLCNGDSCQVGPNRRMRSF